MTPHLDVNANVNVNGHVDTSGTITVQYSLNNLTDFFTLQCENILGPSATTAEVTQCSNNELNSFLATFGVSSGTSSN